MTYQSTWRHLSPRMERAIRELRDALGAGEVWHDNADDYAWRLTLKPGDLGLHDGADVCLELADACEYDGTRNGGNVSLHVVAWGGRILGQITPYNYTPEVWVSLTRKGWRELDRRLDGIVASLPAVADVIRREAA